LHGDDENVVVLGKQLADSVDVFPLLAWSASITLPTLTRRLEVDDFAVTFNRDEEILL